MQYYEEQDYTKQFDLSLWRRLLRYAKPYYPHLLGIALTMVICAAIDVVFPLMTREAIDTFVAGRTTEGLPWFIARYLMFLLLQVGCIFTFCFLSGRTERGICTLIRTRGFKRLQELPFAYYDKTPIGFIIARMTSDTQRLGDTIGWGLLDLMWSIAFVLISVTVMVVINARLALATIVVIPLIALIAIWFQKRILQSYREVRKNNSKITGSFNEGIVGAKTTKTLVREAANEREFVQLTGSMRACAIRAAVLSALFLPIVMSLGSVAAAYALWQGGFDVFTGAISFGTLTVFIQFSTQMFEPISNLARIFAELQSSQAAAERVMQMIETEPEICDSPEVIERFGDNFHPRRENWPPLHGDIEFDDVSFRYTGGEQVLKNFSLKIKAGQTVALVGETGSGKSTIVNLICRFYEPTSGRILIDNVDYKQRSQLWLESHLGYVLQQPHLFSGTVRDNIRYGKLDATDEQVAAAARMVDAEDFILALEKGYDTDVGEGGSRLSTGQKQLVSFARALIANPAIFVLDEATSSVDTVTEQKIQKAIKTALQGRTSFIIAHRLSTIRTADLILVIQDGEICERGSHKELLRQKGYYYRLYVNQFREEREAELLGEGA